MTLFTILLIIVVILAVIGLGWQTFTLAILDGFDRTLDIGIPIIKNLTSETQEANAQNSPQSLMESIIEKTEKPGALDRMVECGITEPNMTQEMRECALRVMNESSND